MADSRPADQPKTDVTSTRGGWTPSRGFLVGLSGVAVFAAILVVAGAIAAVQEPEVVSVSDSTPEPARVSIAPRMTTPAGDLTQYHGASAGAPMVAELASRTAKRASVTRKLAPVSSSWSMSPLPEEGDPQFVTSGTSQSPQ